MISKSILDLLEERKNIYPDLYKHAREFTEKRAIEFDIKLNDFLQFDSKYSLIKSFKTDFLENIHQKYAGTFHTIEKGMSNWI